MSDEKQAVEGAQCSSMSMAAPMELSQEHAAAVSRRRRIAVLCDAKGPFSLERGQLIDYHFGYADEPGSQIDGIFWDLAFSRWALYPSKVLEPLDVAREWAARNGDWVQILLDESHKRGLEAFWSQRMNPLDLQRQWPAPGPDGETYKDQVKVRHPLKKAHPEWVLQGERDRQWWNYAVPAVRAYQLSLLREVAEKYDFDGIHLDFSRSWHCLPPGRQWHYHGAMTEFIRSVREMTLKVENKRGRPCLLAAKVPSTLEKCRSEGLDVQTWAQQNLVDMLMLGYRSMEVDVGGFLRATAGTNIKLLPCHDTHHCTDGYLCPPVEFLRGVYANWWQQGADAVATMNWCSRVDYYQFDGSPPLCPEAERDWKRVKEVAEQQAYHEIGSPETLFRKDKIFVVERYGEGYETGLGKNDKAQLPTPLCDDGRPTNVRVMIGDDLRADADALKQVVLRLILYGAQAGEKLAADMNSAPLDVAAQDFQWKDCQIRKPEPQLFPAGPGSRSLLPIPGQKLLRMDFAVPSRLCRLGENHVSVRVVKRMLREQGGSISIEKLEVHVSYD